MRGSKRSQKQPGIRERGKNLKATFPVTSGGFVEAAGEISEGGPAHVAADSRRMNRPKRLNTTGCDAIHIKEGKRSFGCQYNQLHDFHTSLQCLITIPRSA
jgi:hypothetical protein